jgi:histone-lysine N-methyltransferase SETMAR
MGASLTTRIKACFRKRPSSLSTKKNNVTSTTSTGKIMLTVFWDSQGVLLAHFQRRRENANSVSYCEVLLKLLDAIRRKLPGQLARGVLLHHDNARPHTARPSQEIIQELQWERPEHPSYSQELAPSDFHLFDPLKTPPWWQKFSLMTKRLKRRCRSG